MNRGRLGRLLRPRRRLRTTREGRIFIAITVGLGMAAVNTGNNLLYLVLGWLLSLIVASGALSNLSLRGLKVTRRAPPRVHAGRPFLMEIALENRKRRAASYSIAVEDLSSGRPVDKSCFFLKVPPGRTQRSTYRHTFRRRGLVRMDAFRVATRFPFSLFVKTLDLAQPDELLVYPEVRPMPLPAPRGERQGDAAHSRLGRRGEFFGLRAYREGDDSRSIHWRSSAKSGRLLVREVEEEAQRRVTLEVDNGVDESEDAGAGEALEEAVATAASLALAYLRGGYAVRLLARGAEVPLGAGAHHEQRLLRALALLPAVPRSTPMSGPAARDAEIVRVGA